MLQEKSLGIWMDHTSAHIMVFTAEPIATKVIASKFTRDIREAAKHKSEGLMHNKEQHELAAYYKELGEVIKEYQSVVLFGPTAAKTELLNHLRGNHTFDKIKIEVVQTDKMTENQQHAFVREYFSKKFIHI